MQKLLHLLESELISRCNVAQCLAAVQLMLQDRLAVAIIFQALQAHSAPCRLPITGGSSPQTRRAAAAQIAGILRSHPAQLPAVLADVAVLLRHKDWDTRVAAGYCLGLVAEHVMHHSGAPDGDMAIGCNSQRLC